MSLDEKHLRIDEQVFWLDIAVDDVRSVAERDTFDHLVGEESESFGLEQRAISQTKFKIQHKSGPNRDAILQLQGSKELSAETGQKFACVGERRLCGITYIDAD